MTNHERTLVLLLRTDLSLRKKSDLVLAKKLVGDLVRVSRGDHQLTSAAGPYVCALLAAIEVQS